MRDATHTKIWAGAKGTQPQIWPRTALAECPTCRQPTVGQPFCLRDGTITAAAPFLVGDRYQVEELLGSGGMAFVFGARHQLLGKPVALKVLRREVAADPAQAQRFLREARLSSQLHHENIVNLLDFGHDVERDLNYLVMERCVGRTLADVIGASAPMHWRRAVPIVVQLARALEAAHGQGVSHRDLTPRNVMLVESSGRSDVVKLCDFGLSRMSGSADRITSTGAFLGTPAYVAPEQIRGDAGQDHRVDLYALAALAYEMLTGKLPHEAPTSVALIAAKLTTDPIPASERTPGLEIPPGLEAWLVECLCRDPQRRLGSAAESARVLAALLTAPASDPRARGAEDLIGHTIGSYRVLSKIGSGGVGTVYLGEHPVIGNRVAIKVLQPEVLGVTDIIDRFVEESRASSQIGSPYIARCHDFGFLAGGQPYAIMEFLEGETVAERLKRIGPMEIADVARIGGQVARALDQAHGAGIVHRDIKPENLMLVAGADDIEVVKVLDFGIAKLLMPRGSARKTSTGFVLGTPYYCSPEQLLGEDVGPVADVYALGATLFEMLTGKPPFDGSISEIAGAKLSKQPPPASAIRPGIPGAVTADLSAMLAREPLDRPTTMREVGRMLGAWAEADSNLARSTSAQDLAEIMAARPRRWPWIAAVAGVIGIIAVAIALSGGTETPRSRTTTPSTVPGTAAPEPAQVVVPAPATTPPSLDTSTIAAPAPTSDPATPSSATTPPAAASVSKPAARARSLAPPTTTVSAPSATKNAPPQDRTTTSTSTSPSTTSASRPGKRPSGARPASGIVDPFEDKRPQPPRPVVKAPPKPSKPENPLIVNPFDK